MTSSGTPSAPVAVRVVEPPAERLRRLSITPEVPRPDLWQAIAEAVIDISERIASLEAQAPVRRTNQPEGRT